MANRILKAIQEARNAEEFVFDDDKNKDMSDEEFGRVQDRMDKANRTEMVLPVTSKLYAVAKLQRSCELIKLNRYGQFPDCVRDKLADACNQGVTKIQQHGRKADIDLEDLEKICGMVEEEFGDYYTSVTGQEVGPRLEAVQAWLRRREWWMVINDEEGKLASPNAPVKQLKKKKTGRGHCITPSSERSW